MSIKQDDTHLPLYSPKNPDPTRPTTTATLEPDLKPRKTMRIVDLTVHIPTGKKPLTSTSNKDALPRPRWKTLEFKIYYLIAVIVIPIMVWIPIAASSRELPNYRHYEHRLTRGWLFGREFDNSDHQYRSFRGNLLYLVLASVGYLFAKFIRSIFQRDKTQGYLPAIPFNVVFSLLMIVALHGVNSLKILTILTANYFIAKKCKGSKLGPLLTWVFNGAVLFANELSHGYRFGAVSASLAHLDHAFQGIYPRWYIIFNITMLRLISFNMDFYWASNQIERVPGADVATMNDKQRTDLPHPQITYSYMNYLAYVLYPPLYIAGPIMTFNDFMWQHRRPIVVELQSTLRYLIRFLISFLTMEFILHFMYVVAIKDENAWQGFTPGQISLIGFWNLIIVWLKLLIPWRFFRLWAMMDGILAPENMVRCMANNYSTMGFWRSWHRSYNLWIIRYIYIPLGGSKNVILNTLLVFSFVALWHDLTFRLLAWGWLISLFIIPELLATYLLPKSKFGIQPWYRHVCAIGGVLNILMMMAANLIGFVIGTNGIKFFVSQLFGTFEGLRFLVFACAILFVGVQLMFEYREEEMRNGIYRRC
ncbi:glycerol transporter [Coprinopsis cinerea okayama7|uniref:Glycerol transporter n=1 Tax=Coprinopsis cinerea (strain Okayama-7 / 130 / ATCC MYA-4618 / FGSC 9003) TaxID=240176 RepID=A8NWV2_COPC7|nr:glycerol transporter [Coprinopsis cinerea okayama7\|eukprot:XP_001836993.2 glycerol transporter [Coprinopsis cinerea okayama7\